MTASSFVDLIKNNDKKMHFSCVIVFDKKPTNQTDKLTNKKIKKDNKIDKPI